MRNIVFSALSFVLLMSELTAQTDSKITALEYLGQCDVIINLLEFSHEVKVDTLPNITRSSDPVLWPIGTKWYYEFWSFAPNLTSFKTFEITDTFYYNGEKVWELMTPDGPSMLKQADGKIWIYHDEMDDFQLTYDFNMPDSFDFEWGTICPDSVEGGSIFQSTLYTDSIANIVLPNGDPEFLQHIAYVESTPIREYGSFRRKSIRNIGFDDWGLELNTGYLLCTNHFEGITKLRCFENDTLHLNFVGYACDSTWINASTIEVLQEQISLMPNPVVDVVKIKGLDEDVPYKLFSLDGRLIQEGNSKEMQIEVSSYGNFVLYLQIDKIWISKQLLKVK